MHPFKIGDRVRSAPDSEDVLLMRKTWRARVVAINGRTLETVGRWDDAPGREPTLRPLGARHLVRDE